MIIVSSPPEQAFAAWLRVLARYLVTKRGLSRAVMDSLGKDSELVSSCYLTMHETVDRLLANGQRAGVLRTDLTSTDVLRLVHGVAITTEQAPEETDRLLSLLLDGMRRQLFPIGLGCPYIAGGRFSYGVLRTTVVRVDTFATLRICWRSSSRAAGEATRTLRM